MIRWLDTISTYLDLLLSNNIGLHVARWMDAAFAEWKKVRSEGFINRMWEFQALVAALIYAHSVSQAFSWPSCVTVNCPPTLYLLFDILLFFHTFFPQFLTCNFFLFIISFLHGQNLFSQLEFLDEIDAPSNEERQSGQDDCQGQHPGRCSGNKDSEKGSPKILFSEKKKLQNQSLRAQI